MLIKSWTFSTASKTRTAELGPALNRHSKLLDLALHALGLKV